MAAARYSWNTRFGVTHILFLVESARASDPQAPASTCFSQNVPHGGNLPSFDSWPFVLFGMVLLSIIWLLLQLGIVASHMAWGGAMILFSFVWWNMRLDAGISQVVLWT